jgi:hypothetical protein
VHHVHLDPSIAPLYLLRYSTADLLNSLVDIQGKPPIVHVGHYGQPTVTRLLSRLISPLYFLYLLSILVEVLLRLLTNRVDLVLLYLVSEDHS